MNNPTLNCTPVVMSISSHDASGGAGISADIETLSSLGCHCTPIICKLSAQDTDSIKDSQLIETSLLIGQMRSILEDVNVDLIKVGDLASIANVEAVHTLLNDYPDIPVVLDPFFCSQEIGSQEADADLTSAICNLLFPQALITILSEQDAYHLTAGADSLSAYAHELMEFGSQYLLFTSTEEKKSNSQVCNQLFSHRGLCQQYKWERLPHHFHGAGCTLSAALAGYLSHSFSLAESVQQAQQFTWKAMKKGRRIGMGQLIPDRMHWAKD